MNVDPYHGDCISMSECEVHDMTHAAFITLVRPHADLLVDKHGHRCPVVTLNKPFTACDCWVLGQLLFRWRGYLRNQGVTIDGDLA